VSNIAKEIKQVNDYQVLTDKGFIDIDHIIKTIPFKKYIVLFESGIEIECADNHTFIDTEYNEIYAKNLKEGDKILSQEGYDIVFDIFETEEYENMYDLNLQHHHLYYTNGILSHNSNTMSNFAARQVIHGHNVALMTLEMSQDAFAQRFDAMYSMMDINRMYLGTTNKAKLVRELRNLRDNENRGELFIKQYPTGQASIRDFRIYLRELLMRDIKMDIVYVDYINLMKSMNKDMNGSQMYQNVKSIAEELRALSFEFECPVVSVSQLNREGSAVNFESLDFTYIAESMGLPATADFMAIYGVDEDALVYQNEVHYKIVKNRLGGQVGAMDKFYFDARTLKMYDNPELDQWLDDANKTGDERNAADMR